jgi:hypothetical protein
VVQRYVPLLLVLLLALMPGAARANGDPASDVLYLQDTYLPYERPSEGVASDLQAAVADANKAGYRTKVAIIATPDDLGLVASLFGQPQVYARFLGAEIRSFFTGHLLVVMPQGFGIWFDRFDVKPQQVLLREVAIESGDPEGLTNAAAAAVRLLAQRDTSRPRIPDLLPPVPRARPATAKRGTSARLSYTVYDESGRSREEVRVYGAKLALLAVLRSPMEAAKGTVDSVRWRVPKRLQPRALRFCVVAIDAAGNQSRASCATLRIK